jgi:hypothetical protein
MSRKDVATYDEQPAPKYPQEHGPEGAMVEGDEEPEAATDRVRDGVAVGERDGRVDGDAETDGAVDAAATDPDVTASSHVKAKRPASLP